MAAAMKEKSKKKGAAQPKDPSKIQPYWLEDGNVLLYNVRLLYSCFNLGQN